MTTSRTAILIATSILASCGGKSPKTSTGASGESTSPADTTPVGESGSDALNAPWSDWGLPLPGATFGAYGQEMPDQGSATFTHEKTEHAAVATLYEEHFAGYNYKRCETNEREDIGALEVRLCADDCAEVSLHIAAGENETTAVAVNYLAMPCNDGV